MPIFADSQIVNAAEYVAAREQEWLPAFREAAEAFAPAHLAPKAYDLEAAADAALRDAVISSAQPSAPMAAALLYLRIADVRGYAAVKLVGEVLRVIPAHGDSLTLRGAGGDTVTSWVRGEQQRGKVVGPEGALHLLATMLPPM